MRFKHIMLFFLISLPVALFSRFVQILYLEDAATGFFIRNYEFLGNFLTALIILACIINFAISHLAYIRPEKPPKASLATGIASVALGVGVGFEIFTETFSANVRIWQIVSLDLLGILTAVFFILYGIKMIIGYPLPKLFYIVPTLYWIMRLICIFTAISSISLIVDNFITLASHCLVIIFMCNIGKLYNGIDKDRIFRKLLSTGLCSVILCAADAVPRLLFTVLGRKSYIHSGVSSAVSVMLCGIFILCFLLAYFSEKNKGRKDKHSK